MKRITYQGINFVPFIDREQIKNRVQAIARQIEHDHRDENPLFVCVLNGAFPFAADLIREVGMKSEIAFMRLKSYEGTSSTGTIKEVMGLQEDIEGRTVIIVEDIVDTGRTIKHILDTLSLRKPAKLKVATLLHKPEAAVVDVKPDYVGFSMPARFIIGYGLDIDGQARNLPDIWVKED